MSGTVDFDNQLAINTNKIDDVTINGVQTPELSSAQAADCAKRATAVLLRWSVSYAAFVHFLATAASPSPAALRASDLSPVGRGVAYTRIGEVKHLWRAEPLARQPHDGAVERGEEF